MRSPKTSLCQPHSKQKFSKPYGLLTLTLASLLLSSCSSLLYYPTRHNHVSTERLDPKPRDIELDLKTGEKIHGWYFSSKQNEKQKPMARILFFHGNGQNITTHFLSLYWILDHPVDFFVFDYPGYGKSTGEPSPHNTVVAGLAAYEWLEDQNPDIPIVIFGQSLGGAVAMRTVKELNNEQRSNICLLTVDSSFLSYQSVAQDALASSWLTWPLQWLGYLLLSDRWAPEGHLESLQTMPLVVIHGDDDRTIYPKRSKEIFEKAKEPKELWIIPGIGHIESFAHEDDNIYRDKFVEKIKQHCSDQQSS